MEGFCSSVPLRNSTHCRTRCLIWRLRHLARFSIAGQNLSPHRESWDTAFSIVSSQKAKFGKFFRNSGSSASGKRSQSRQATVTRRIVGSDESTCDTTQAGQPSARQKSRSSVRIQCSQVKASRASPRKARSGSTPLRRPSTLVAVWVAWSWISNRGRRSAQMMSRWKRKVARSCSLHSSVWNGQKLQSSQKLATNARFNRLNPTCTNWLSGPFVSCVFARSERPRCA